MSKTEKFLTAFTKKEIIVNSGSINSTKLLMLSGIGPKEHLSNLNISIKQDLRVWENLQDHASFIGLVVGFSRITATLITHRQLLKELINYSKMESKQGPVDIAVFMIIDVQIIAQYVLSK